MNVGIIGCGYVADYYVRTLALHLDLVLAGVADLRAERAAHFASYHGLRVYESTDAMLADRRIDLVINLTPPRSHFHVSRAALDAGKHVYSEKPLAQSVGDAEELVARARARGLLLSGAPCSVLNPSAQTLWKALREGQIGRPLLAYAECDDGLTAREPYSQWISESGAPWPAKVEFETGCVVEHAAYPVSWLAAYFGPVRHITAFASCQLPDKGVDDPGPDLGIAALRFASGLVCRLTVSNIAPRSRRLTIIGEEGVLSTANFSDDGSPVHLRRRWRLRRRGFVSPVPRRVALRGPSVRRLRFHGPQRRDFASGIAELGAAIREGRTPALSSEFVSHVNAVALAIDSARDKGINTEITSSFPPLRPMSWAD